MSNVGLWEPTYRSRNAFPYGNEQSYRIGAEFLRTCRTVKDWGCGTQWFRRMMQQIQQEVRIIGLDGSPGFCDRTVDLTQYRPTVRPEGVFMRHVLEHNYNWRTILDRALASFTQRMCLVCFTPFADEETVLSVYQFPTGGSCPYLSLPRKEIDVILQRHGVTYEVESLPSPGTEYGRETVFWISRSASERTTRQTDAVEPLVSCLCPTYRRPDLLANSIACFLTQDYPASRRELLILDDADQYASHSGNGWEVVSVRRRFHSLPEKFNALAGMAQGEIFVVWEDDDVYLPWHISSHVRVIQSGHAFSKPGRVRSHYAGKCRDEPASGRFHGSIAFTRKAFDSVGGWPLTQRGDFDQQLMSRLSALGPIGNPTEKGEPSYIFRWEATGEYHGQGLMQSGSDTQWYQRAENLGQATRLTEIVPGFDAMTRTWMTAGAMADG